MKDKKKSFIWDDISEQTSENSSQKEETSKEEPVKEPVSDENLTSLKSKYEELFETKDDEANNENLFDQPKDEDEPEYYLEDEQKRKKVTIFRLVIIGIILAVIACYFLPVFKVEKVKMNETSFITKNQLMKSLGVSEGSRYSLYKMSKLEKNVDTDSATATSSNYSIKNQTLSVKINEVKPLAENSNGELYYVQDGSIKKTTELSYYVPRVEGFDEKTETKIIKELKGLDYNIIKEMSVIASANVKGRDDLVYIQMKDGNYVQITINQISEKMKYYMQIQEIIKEKKDGKPGIIHLDVGDYYEPL